MYPIRLGVNIEDIEKVKGVVEKIPGMVEYLGSVTITTHEITMGSATNFFLATKGMQGFWQQPKHNIGSAI